MTTHKCETEGCNGTATGNLIVLDKDVCVSCWHAYNHPEVKIGKKARRKVIVHHNNVYKGKKSNYNKEINK